MRDETWVQGMKELAASFPDKDLPESVLETRGDIYRRELQGLTDGQWLFAVSEAIRNERWFPTVHTLLEYSESAGAPQRHVAGLLPAHEPDPEEQKAIARRGVKLIREVLRERGIEVGEPVRDMPEASGVEPR